MRDRSWWLMVIGAVMTAAIVPVVVLIERGRLPNFTMSYVWMMIVPAIAAAAVLMYERRRGVTRASTFALLAVGLVIATYPFWGHYLDKGMAMPLGWMGTILGHYVAGAIFLAGVLLRFVGGTRAPLANRS